MHRKYMDIYIPPDHTERMFNSTRLKSIQMVLCIKTAALLPFLFTDMSLNIHKQSFTPTLNVTSRFPTFSKKTQQTP